MLACLLLLLLPLLLLLLLAGAAVVVAAIDIAAIAAAAPGLEQVVIRMVGMVMVVVMMAMVVVVMVIVVMGEGEDGDGGNGDGCEANADDYDELSGCDVVSTLTSNRLFVSNPGGHDVAKTCDVFFASGELQKRIGAVATLSNPVLTAHPKFFWMKSKTSLVSSSSGPKSTKSYRTTSRYGNIVSKFHGKTRFN